MNAERTSRGLSVLTREGCADGAARAHAQRMADEDRMHHQGLEPLLAACAARRAAENVGSGTVAPERMVQLWMDSTGHRATILDPELSTFGSGAAQRPDGRWYASTVFLGR